MIRPFLLTAGLAVAQLILLLLCLPFLTLNAHPARRGIEECNENNGTCREIFQWGSNSVLFLHYVEERFADQVLILDAEGRTIFEIRGNPHIVAPEIAANNTSQPSPPFMDVTGDGVPELIVTAWSGGAHCCYTEFVFKRTAGIRNILIWYGREWNLKKSPHLLRSKPAVRIPNAGNTFLFLPDDSITLINGSNQNAGPVLLRVLKWTDTHFIDATAQYPEFQSARMNALRHEIAAISTDSRNSITFRDNLAELYSLSILSGKEAEAISFLKEIDEEEWLRENAARLHRAVPLRSKRFGHGNTRLLRASDWAKTFEP